MQTVRSYFFGPTPQEQNRKWQSIIRKEQRQLDRQVYHLKAGRKKAEVQLKQLAKQSDITNMRILAKEIARANRHGKRLAESKALLGSLSLQLNDQMAMLKIQGTMQSSTKIMQDVSSLIRLPQLSETMRNLSMELTKAGVLEEMRDEMFLPVEDDEELMDLADEDEEVQEILTKYNVIPAPSEKAADAATHREQSLKQALPSLSNGIAKDSTEIDEEQLLDIRDKLDALKS
ncbi:Vacuolar sorting protein Vps24 [Schizosaccharomyces pombe]|uniref:Vacuolar protein sorting-associated protein 24 n=1 Tax=Schizosaccharomyces pombe (strain 972 / ATCC 24843) TaxID=284812 RepID=VPS24_SCHPO|nr:ESCRT III complex subunit Vps24 [Schizosaccharomyces pombe]O14296.1 RecName: Full=Vacuolar protein sorting-associated protein 24 [Schizosaccharomyces pombe 972h-]CAB16412.1 ESCRT III complex subunit Vps24 [Schizosaccharomyces pombe]|eukprot:NP_594587.1 ESCRT III complex subunit Vps24 [Schizosaccharomyces pombe]